MKTENTAAQIVGTIDVPKARQPTRTSAQNATIGAKQISALRTLLADVRRPDWRPLRSWPACDHPEQHRIDQFLRRPGRGPS
jgi:hypothetical protein